MLVGWSLVGQLLPSANYNVFYAWEKYAYFNVFYNGYKRTEQLCLKAVTYKTAQDSNREELIKNSDVETTCLVNQHGFIVAERPNGLNSTWYKPTPTRSFGVKFNPVASTWPHLRCDADMEEGEY